MAAEDAISAERDMMSHIMDLVLEFASLANCDSVSTDLAGDYLAYTVQDIVIAVQTYERERAQCR
jgi:hypothetical protein